MLQPKVYLLSPYRLGYYLPLFAPEPLAKWAARPDDFVVSSLAPRCTSMYYLGARCGPSRPRAVRRDFEIGSRCRSRCESATLLRAPPAVSVEHVCAQRASINARHLSRYSWRLLAAFWMSYLT